MCVPCHTHSIALYISIHTKQQTSMDLQTFMETFAEAWVAANTCTPLSDSAAVANNDQVSALLFYIL